jgi:hypothetical protein
VLEIADHAVVLEHGSVVYDGAPGGAVRAIERVLQARGRRSVTLGGDWHDRPVSSSIADSSRDLASSRGDGIAGRNGMSG